MISSKEAINKVEEFSAHNYKPLEIVIAKADGAWVWDPEGNKFLDMLSAYSALNFGHCHEPLIAKTIEQLNKVTLTSRAFHNDQLGPFCEELATFCKLDKVLPMNTGAEGVETALKTARKWGYQVKGVEKNKAEIIVCDGNFHGRTISIISFSDEPNSKDDFGPYTPGFKSIEYGNIAALKNAITPNTVGFLFEPVQGEGGVIIPPPGYLKEVRKVCTEENILMIADEIQSGLGRSGKTFACDWENIIPDIYILGKALGGGILPLSAVVSTKEILGVFKPGQHGSTFGGNPLACSVGRAVLDILKQPGFLEEVEEKGAFFKAEITKHHYSAVTKIRQKGLWLGIDIHPDFGNAKKACKILKKKGVLCKGTHVHTIRVAPPLNITWDDLKFGIAKFNECLSEISAK